MKFLRTAPTRRLLTAITGLVVAILAGTAIAVAATSGGPKPPPKPLATAVHDALGAPAVTGVYAHIRFTDDLIDSSAFPGQTADPLLQGASGRFWLSNDHRLRLELQTDNGDANLVVQNGTFWVSDPATHTVYEGTLPAGADAKSSKAKSAKADAVPSIAQIKSEIARLMTHVELSGAKPGSVAPTPTDVAGHPTYTVSISPKHDGGLLGSAQLAWDAATGVPLKIAIYSRDKTDPVLALQATSVKYGNVGDPFDIAPPSGDKVVKISSAQQAQSARRVHAAAKRARAKHAEVSGVAAVAGKLAFPLIAPPTLVGLPRHGVDLLSSGGKPGAVVLYGQNLGGVAVIEEPADSSQKTPSSGNGGLNLPTVSIHGATGTELSTPLGTVLTFKSADVNYTVIGSLQAATAQAAALGLGTNGP